jgi:hypothetical protein
VALNSCGRDRGEEGSEPNSEVLGLQLLGDPQRGGGNLGECLSGFRGVLSEGGQDLVGALPELPRDLVEGLDASLEFLGVALACPLQKICGLLLGGEETGGEARHTFTDPLPGIFQGVDVLPHALAEVLVEPVEGVIGLDVETGDESSHLVKFGYEDLPHLSQVLRNFGGDAGGPLRPGRGPGLVVRRRGREGEQSQKIHGLSFGRPRTLCKGPSRDVRGCSLCLGAGECRCGRDRRRPSLQIRFFPVAYLTGLRKGDLLALKRFQIHLDGAYKYIEPDTKRTRGKNKQCGEPPLTDEAVEALREAMKVRSLKYDNVFLYRGNP